MKCINRLFLVIGVSLCLTGCGGEAYSMPYNPDYEVSSYQINSFVSSDKLTSFAEDLCVVSEDSEGLDLSTVGSAGLFSLKDAETYYAKNVYEKLHPASLTKVLTALVALKHGTTDQILTASENVLIKESGAQLCGLKPGEQMTLDQALHILLMYSANDVAVMIAENIGGSVEQFAEMMNEEAAALGATNSHFVNPHGLTAENHYVTAYDMYLIFNEAMKYELFNEIIHMTSYSMTYVDQSGNTKELSVNTTNLYLREDVSPPENVTVIGGKTGTTNAAGHCLVLLSKDASGSPYISIILNADSRDDLYSKMTDILGEINR